MSANTHRHNHTPRLAEDLSSTTSGKNEEPVSILGRHWVLKNDGSLGLSSLPLLSVPPGDARRPTPGRLLAVLTPNSHAFALSWTEGISAKRLYIQNVHWNLFYSQVYSNKDNVNYAVTTHALHLNPVTRYCPAVLRARRCQLKAAMKRLTHFKLIFSGHRVGSGTSELWRYFDRTTPHSLNSSMTLRLCCSAFWIASSRPALYSRANRLAVNTSAHAPHLNRPNNLLHNSYLMWVVVGCVTQIMLKSRENSTKVFK